MSMSTIVYGIRKPDDKWKKMVKAWKACKDAGVNPPLNLEDYFDKMDCLPPDEETGPKVCIDDEPYCAIYNEEMHEGFQIELQKMIKAGFTHVRFVNCY